MGEEDLHDPQVDPRLRSKGDESERILQDAFLTGGRDLSGTGRLSVGKLTGALNDTEPRGFKQDSSWGSRAEEEGAAGRGRREGSLAPPAALLLGLSAALRAPLRRDRAATSTQGRRRLHRRRG